MLTVELNAICDDRGHAQWAGEQEAEEALVVQDVEGGAEGISARIGEDLLSTGISNFDQIGERNIGFDTGESVILGATIE